MTTPSRNGYAPEDVLDLPSSYDKQHPRLDDYLLESGQKLSAIADLVNRGEEVDRDSHTWMLAQVDFVVEIVSNEGLELGDDIRPQLLQFLLAVANLNEQIRHHASMRR
jgi:ribosome assembly protein YihI (activator of Der GTPase)